MLAQLARIRDDADHENEYVGEGGLRRLQGKLDEIEVENNYSQILRLQKGKHLRRLGRTDEAIDELLLLYQVLKGHLHLNYQLALTFLRAAENQNCVDNNTAESCLLPIRGSGVHVKKDYARQAMKHFEATLNIMQDYPGAIWLLNLAARAAGE